MGQSDQSWERIMLNPLRKLVLAALISPVTAGVVAGALVGGALAAPYYYG